VSGELVKVDGQQITWAQPVQNLVSILHPLGAAAQIVAHITACAAEISRFSLAKRQLAAQHMVASKILQRHEQDVLMLFEVERHRSRGSKVTRDGLIAGFHRIVSEVCGTDVAPALYDLANAAIPILSDAVVKLEIAQGDHLINLCDALRLGSVDAAVKALRQLDS
jgi:hypothetical protein